MLERYDRKFSIMPSVYPLCEILPMKNKNAVKNNEIAKPVENTKVNSNNVKK